MWNLENGTDEPICKAEIETQMYRTNVWTPGRKGNELEDWNWHIYTTVYKIDN